MGFAVVMHSYGRRMEERGGGEMLSAPAEAPFWDLRQTIRIALLPTALFILAGMRSTGRGVRYLKALPVSRLAYLLIHVNHTRGDKDSR